MPAALRTRHAGRIAGEIGPASAPIRRLGVVPSYYLRYFYHQTRPSPGNGQRAARVAQIEERLLAMYADPALDAVLQPLAVAADAARPPRAVKS